MIIDSGILPDLILSSTQRFVLITFLAMQCLYILIINTSDGEKRCMLPLIATSR